MAYTFVKDTERYAKEIKSIIGVINKIYIKHRDKKKEIDADEILAIIQNARNLCKHLDDELYNYEVYFNKVKSGLY